MKIHKVTRIVPHDDASIKKNYPWVIELFPDSVIIEDEDGIYRFQENSLVRHMIYERIIDLNQVWADYYDKKFSLIDIARFYRDIGYSLSGWLDIFYHRFYTQKGTLRKKLE